MIERRAQSAKQQRSSHPPSSSSSALASTSSVSRRIHSDAPGSVLDRKAGRVNVRLHSPSSLTVDRKISKRERHEEEHGVGEHEAASTSSTAISISDRQVNGRHMSTHAEGSDDRGGQADADCTSVPRRKRSRKSQSTQFEGEGQEDAVDRKPQIKSEKGFKTSGEDDFAFNHGDRDEAGFLPGSIVRVALKNFVTYDSTEFRPGPYLNMIIGPNGTGKSTIVCAIALGLGWKPAVLGRAKDIASFVKQGYQDGWIEIELKGLEGENNIIIKRLISRKDNTSDWRLNGKQSTARAVNDAVSRFEVNVDNLCCFLPQEKVADFARMDPPKLLIETQRAAGNPNLSAWHAQLIAYGAELRELQMKLDRDQEEQNNLEQRNEVLGRDVERYEQRKQIEEEIALLNLLIPFAEYYNAKHSYDEAKLVRNQRKAELEELRQVHEPLKLKVEGMRMKRTKLEHNRQNASESLNKVNRELISSSRKMEQLESDTTELQDNVANLKTREQEHQKLTNQLKNVVAELEAKVADVPEDFDLAAIDRALRENRQEIRAADVRRGDLIAQIDDIGLENRHLQTSQDDTLRKLKRLDDLRARRLELLRQADEHCYRAVQWLRANGNLFQKKVYEPIMLEITVKDARYAAQVESCINFATQKTFVCETRADYDLLARELNDRQKLRINIAELEGGRTRAEMEAVRPLSVRQVQDLGFDTYISELIDGPAAVMEYLYSSAHIHTIPVAIADTVDLAKVEKSRQIKRYVVGHANHTVQFSEYGRKLPVTLSRDIKPPRSLTQTVNAAEKEALERTIREIVQKFKDAEESIGELKEQVKEEEDKAEDYRARKEELERQKMDAIQPRRDWEKAKLDLDNKRKRLDAELKRPSQDTERKRLMAEVARNAEKRIRVMQDMKALLVTQTKHRIDVDVATLMEVQHSVNHQAWKEALNSRLAEFKDAEKALREALEEFAAIKTSATQLQARAQSKHNDAPAEIQEKFRQKQAEMDDETALDLRELESEMATLQGSLDLSAGVAPGVIEAYKKRAEQIARLGDSIATQRGEVARRETKIDRIKSQWLPALKSLANKVSEKFSAALDRIGCAGEVQLSEQGNFYEKWGLDILVKFRDEEQLQLLTGQRQSGGERSLSTILYLMSLTELSRSPFSLVDEINQGMDQRAERAVHDQMVQVTCRAGASQYFLITPKLLPDLRYDERMKVLIINNGEWLPEKLDLARFAKRRMAQRDGGLGVMGGQIAGGGGDGGGGEHGSRQSQSQSQRAIAV